jgi:hypothetical protein
MMHDQRRAQGEHDLIDFVGIKVRWGEKYNKIVAFIKLIIFLAGFLN